MDYGKEDLAFELLFPQTWASKGKTSGGKTQQRHILQDTWASFLKNGKAMRNEGGNCSPSDQAQDTHGLKVIWGPGWDSGAEMDAGQALSKPEWRTGSNNQYQLINCDNHAILSGNSSGEELGGPEGSSPPSLWPPYSFFKMHLHLENIAKAQKVVEGYGAALWAGVQDH